MKDLTVLITAAGNVYMPGTIGCIKNNGERDIRVIGADMNDDPSMLNMCDKYYPVPRGDAPEYADEILKICREEQVDIVIPIMSVELEGLSLRKKDFEAIGTKVSVSDIEPLKTANDKLKLFEYLKSKGFECAGFKQVTSIDELKEGAYELGYGSRRVCVKMTGGSGSRGFRILDAALDKYEMFAHEKPTSAVITLEDMVEILDKAKEFPQLMLMEYLPGDEYTADLIAKDGKVLCTCIRKGLRIDTGIMLDSLVVDDPVIENMCVKVTESLGLSGNIGFDIKTNKDGAPVIMECNPRMTAGVPVFEYAGVNLPYLNIKAILGEDVKTVKPKAGVIVRRRWMEMQA